MSLHKVILAWVLFALFAFALFLLVNNQPLIGVPVMVALVYGWKEKCRLPCRYLMSWFECPKCAHAG